MDFVLKVVLSFIVGGAYVSGVIWASERLGSRIGGAVAGLPSTILVGLAFIDITEGPSAARSAVAIVPLMFFATLIYGLIFMKATSILKGKNRTLSASLIATIVWLAVALATRQFSNVNFLYIVLVAIFGLVGFRYLFRNFGSIPPVKIPLSQRIYALRFVIGGTVIACSVVVARAISPVWGGIVSSFPALLGSVLYFLNKSQGSEFLKGFLRRLPLSYLSSLIFIILIHQLIIRVSGFYSFLIAMAGATAYTFLLVFLRPAEK